MPALSTAPHYKAESQTCLEYLKDFFYLYYGEEPEYTQIHSHQVFCYAQAHDNAALIEIEKLGCDGEFLLTIIDSSEPEDVEYFDEVNQEWVYDYGHPERLEYYMGVYDTSDLTAADIAGILENLPDGWVVY